MHERPLFRFGEVSGLVGAGIFCIINSDARKVDIRHSKNLLEGISRNITLLARGEHTCVQLQLDASHLEFKTLELVADHRERLLAHGRWITWYKSQGYNLYREKPALTLRLRVDVENYLFHVKLENSNHDKITVGVFDNKEEVDWFLDRFYTSNTIQSINYANNDLTRKLLGR